MRARFVRRTVIGVFTAGIAVGMLVGPAAAGVSKPDLLVSKKAKGGYEGNDVYLPNSQIIGKRLPVNKWREVFVKIQQDGGGSNIIRVRGFESDSTMKRRYFLNGENVTDEVTVDSPSVEFTVAPGEAARMRVELKAKPSFPSGEFATVLTADSDSQLAIDQVIVSRSNN